VRSATLLASGARHRGDGVMASRCEVVREALIWALEQTTPTPPFSAEARKDWIEAYPLMAHVMQKGSEGLRA
jgi:hemoglobin-like flavoprotein